MRSFELIMKAAFAFGVALIIAWLCCGCKTIQTVVETHEVYVHDTTLQVDSIYQDRYHTIYAKGDTIYKVDSVFLYKYKYIDKDVEVFVHDSIPYVVEVEKPVRYRSGFDKFCVWNSIILWIILAIGIAIWILLKMWLKICLQGEWRLGIQRQRI